MCDSASFVGAPRAHQLAALLRTAQRGLSPVEVATGRENGREPIRRGNVAGRVREFVRTLGAGQIPALLKYRTQVEGTILVAALVGALVTGLRRTQVSARLAENAEVQRGACMAECVGFAVGELGAGRIAPLLEQHPQAELLNGSTAAIDQCVYAPRHLPAFLTIRSHP